MSPSPERAPTQGQATCQVDADGVVARCTAGFALQLSMPYHAIIGRPIGVLLDVALGIGGVDGARAAAGRAVVEDHDACVRVTFEPLVAESGTPDGALVAIEALPAGRRELACALQPLVAADLMAVVIWNRQGRVVEANDAWFALVGGADDDPRALDWTALLAPSERGAFEGAAAEASAVGVFGPGRLTLQRVDGAAAPVLFAMAASPGGERFVACLVDAATFVRVEQERERVLEREQGARIEVEEAQRRLGFLYQATSALFEEARDPRQLLERLAELCVPHLADWCLVDVLERDGAECVAAAHWDPELAATAAGLRRRWRLDPGAPQGVARAARAGRTQVGTADDGGGAAETEDRRLLARLRAHSWIQVPVRRLGRTLAVITLAFAESTRVHGPEDVALAEDLAARVAIALENARLFDEVQRAVRAREEALHIVSHDLKNPIAVLLLKAQRLRRVVPSGPEGARARALVEQLERTILGMNHLIEGLLDLARLEAGRLKLDRRLESPRAIVARAVEPLQSLALERGQRLENAVSPALPPIEVDPDRMAQVLSNLLSNALKYTPEGGHIRVEARATPTEIRFTVVDDGPGIPEDQLPHLFERFWQARAAGRTGHGLGLSIVQGLVEAHDGRVWVDSEPGRGSRFHFAVPRRPAASDGEG